MSDYEFDLNIEAELAGIRGYNRDKSDKPEKTQKQRPKPEQTNPVPAKKEPPKEPEQAKPAPPPEPEITQPKPGQGSSGASTPPEQANTPSHSHGGEGGASSSSVATESKKEQTSHTSSVDWKRFKTLSGIFEHVGGERPVRLNPNIKKSHATGIPEPMIGIVQRHLKEKHAGAVVAFPWGEYEITENNRVFTTKSSLVRYLLFDGLRDADGTHVQYAKQSMVLNHPVFDQGFNPETHLGPNNDELDIYALLFVAHTSEEYNETSSGAPTTEQDYQTAERLGMLNMSMGRILEKLNEQENAFREYAERNTVMQTVVLLDRMGLLQGGLPRDMGEFVRVLEENRHTLSETDTIVSDHVQQEKERKKILARQERMRKMQQREAR